MCRGLPRTGGISRLRALCITISDDRGDESFADDLNMGRGIVSGRVALLLRSTEIRPHRPNDLSPTPPKHFPKFSPPCGRGGPGSGEGGARPPAQHLAKNRTPPIGKSLPPLRTGAKPPGAPGAPPKTI
jgi:hypothetical protein